MASRSARGVRPSLDIAAIGRCLDAYLDVIAHIDAIRVTNDGAHLIQYPKLPSTCTQELVRDLIVAGWLLGDIGPIADAMAGRKAADVVVLLADGATVHIEVKATAKDYTALTAADLIAPFFVWLDFRSFGASRLVSISTVRGPVGRFGWLPGRALHMRKFLRDTVGERETKVLDFAAWTRGEDPLVRAGGPG